MTTDSTRTRPLRNVTATVTATGSALSVVLVPLVVGALVARTVGGDPMVSVNALIAGGGQRARLSRSQLRGYRCRTLAAARVAPGRSARWSSRRTGGETSIGS